MNENTDYAGRDILLDTNLLVILNHRIYPSPSILDESFCGV